MLITNKKSAGPEKNRFINAERRINLVWPVMKPRQGKDESYMQILEDLDARLLEMREHPKMLASNEP